MSADMKWPAEEKRIVTDAEAQAHRLAGCNPPDPGARWLARFLGSDSDPSVVIGALLDTRDALKQGLAPCHPPGTGCADCALRRHLLERMDGDVA